MFMNQFHCSKESLFQVYPGIYIYVYVYTQGIEASPVFWESDTFPLLLTITGNGDNPIKRPKINEISSLAGAKGKFPLLNICIYIYISTVYIYIYWCQHLANCVPKSLDPLHQKMGLNLHIRRLPRWAPRSSGPRSSSTETMGRRPAGEFPPFHPGGLVGKMAPKTVG